MPIIWKLIFSFAVGLGIFLSSVFFISTYRRRPNIFLSLVLLGFSLQITTYILIWDQQSSLTRFIPIGFALDFMYGPALLVYIKSLQNGGKVTKKMIFHFIPFVFILLFGLSPYWMRIGPFLKYFLINRCGLLFLVIYAFIIHRANQKLWIQSKKISWFQAIEVFYLFYVVGMIGYYVVSRFEFFNMYWDYGICCLMLIGFYGLGVSAYLHPYLIKESQLRRKVLEPKYETSALTEQAIHSIISSLHEQMERHQWYANSISMDQLAEHMDISKHQISQAINQGLGMSYPEFLNNFRIRKAAEMIRDQPELSVKEIYYTAGFSNKTSFYKYFKQYYQMTPLEYKTQLASEGTTPMQNHPLREN